MPVPHEALSHARQGQPGAPVIPGPKTLAELESSALTTEAIRQATTAARQLLAIRDLVLAERAAASAFGRASVGERGRRAEYHAAAAIAARAEDDVWSALFVLSTEEVSP